MAKQSNHITSNEEKQTVFGHLAALRKVLIICAISIGVAFILAFYFAVDWTMELMLSPIRARGIDIIYTALSEALVTKVKVGLIIAIVGASPIIIWQIWGFIKPALYDKEKRVFRMLFFVMLVLFLIGVVFCYGIVYMLAVDFFLIAGENLAVPMLSVDKYVGFLFGFVVPFGLAFELPVVLYMTTRIGWTDYRMLSSKRRYIILAIAIIAAFLTPPDVVSQLMLGIPMLLLFEMGVLVTRFVKKRNRA